MTTAQHTTHPQPGHERATARSRSPRWRASHRHEGWAGPSLCRGGTWTEMSYAELGTAVREIARGLIALGIRPGDRVSILSNTRAEWTLADLGALCAGAVVAPIYHTNSPGECHYVLEHAGSRLVFCEDAEQAAKVEQVREHARARARRHLRRLGRRRHLARGAAAAAAKVDPTAPDEIARLVQPEDMATIVYTSGTTGPPKGCITTHANCMATARMYEEELASAPPTSDRRVHVPAARPFARARDADGGARRGRHDRLLARRPEGRARRPGGHPPDSRALRAARLREGAHQGAARRRGGRPPEARDLPLGARDGPATARARAPAAPRPAPCSAAGTRWPTGSSSPRCAGCSARTSSSL